MLLFPLQFLSSKLGKQITLTLKTEKRLAGLLKACDKHMNIEMLTGTKSVFVKGISIFYIEFET